jgi:hypothetical protein
VHILEEMVDAVGVEGAGAADQPVHLVSLAEQKFRQIGSVLTSNTRDERSFHGVFP